MEKTETPSREPKPTPKEIDDIMKELLEYTCRSK